MIFFTSDTHFSHANIIQYCDRPFRDTDEMDEAIIRNWNETVMPTDTVYLLGDVALGPIEKSLAKVSRLNGYKICVLGNHDRPFMRMDKPDESDWWDKYAAVFEEVWHWSAEINTLVMPQVGNVRLSHFPFTGDHTPVDRHSEHRPVDRGVDLLIHGHTHQKQRFSRSANGTPQIHVGQDAWDFTPVSEREIVNLLQENS